MVSFPLLPKRRGDRTFAPPFSPAHDVLLEIPAARQGRVRLQLSMPWRHEKGHIALVLEWAKLASLPGAMPLAKIIWSILKGGRQSHRTRRRGLKAYKLNIAPWFGTLYVPSADLPGVPRLDPANAVRWLAAGLDYANMMLIGRWWSHRNPNAWIYAMHQFIALLVGNELARTYLTGLPYVPSSFLQLHKAVPHFRSQIRACTTSARVTPARVTPHRLAMALVDAKFYGARPPLLNPYRTNETRWQRVMPAKKARRIRALIKKDRYVADWCARWRSLMVTCPRADYVFFKAPGDDDLAARVWRALYL